MGGSLGPHGSSLGSLLFGWNLHKWAVLLEGSLCLEKWQNTATNVVQINFSMHFQETEIISNWTDQRRLSGKGKT